MMVSTQDIELESGKEIIISWKEKKEDPHNQNTKPEYAKIYQDGKYLIHYEIRWHHIHSTTQPLEVALYVVRKDYEFVAIHRHVTVCTGNPINLRKDFTFDFLSGERICIGVKNMSSFEFILLECIFSLKQQ